MKRDPKTWQDEALIEITKSLASIAKSLKELSEPKASTSNGITHSKNLNYIDTSYWRETK